MAEFNSRFHKFNNTDLIVNIEFTPEYKIRRWVAIRLIVLAGWVLGCDIRMEHG